MGNDSEKKEKRKGRQISFWLVPGDNSEHDYLLDAIQWWRSKRDDISEKLRLGLTLVAYIDTGDIDGFLSKIPASFYANLIARLNYPAAIPSASPTPNLIPIDNTTGGIEAYDIDKNQAVSSAADNYASLFE